MRLRLERRRRHHYACDRLIEPRQIAYDVLDVIDSAQYRNISNQLSEIRPRRRQQTDRPQPLDGAAFNSAQENFDVGSAADQ